MNWYFAHAGEQQGPVSQAQFDQLVARGDIRDTTLVWHDGLAGWQPWGDLRPAAAAPPAPPTLGPAPTNPSPEVPGTVRCGECGGGFAEDAVVRFGPQVVCAGCKPLFLQRLREGAHRPEQLVLAGLGRRFVADFLDNLILMVPLFFLMFGAGAVIGMGALSPGGMTPGTATGMAVFQVLLQVLYLGLYVLYNALLTGRYGQTWGKRIMGLKVVLPDGSRPTYGRAFARAGAEVLSGMACYLGYLVAFFDAEKRSLHDHICNTRVVKQ